MIRNQLEPINPGLNITLPEILEAFAFTYLSGYNTLSISPRVNTAFVRAWKPDSIINIPRVSGGRPGGTVALWTSQQYPRMLVAIEGISSIGNLGFLMTGLDGDPIAPSSGRVCRLWQQWADSFYTALTSNGVINTFITTRPHLVTWAGHSGGAAMAEVLAFKTKVLYPSRTNRLIKFASPRVGTARWIADRPPSIRTNSVYSERDPIHWLPWFGRPTVIDQVTNPLSPLCVFRRDDPPTRFTVRQGIQNRYEIEPSLSHARHVSGYFGDPLAPYWWGDHTMDSYRLTFMNYAAAAPDTLMWRFNYLEHEDENNWQLIFRPRIALSGLPHTLLDPPPDEAGPPSQAAVYEADSDVGAFGSGAWGGGADQGDDEWARAPWQIEPVAVTRTLPRRRVRGPQ